MISPDELHRKAFRMWGSGEFLCAWMRCETLFPMEIRVGMPSGRRLGDDFSIVGEWIAGLKKGSREINGSGYRIDYRSVEHRRLGRQDLPYQICFENESDWLIYIGRDKDFIDFKKIALETRQRQPQLIAFLEQKPLKALEFRQDWSMLLTICEWFRTHPYPDLYLRQLDIEGMDTKFIETRKGILTELLDLVLNRKAIVQPGATGGRNGFERRFGLKYDQPIIRLRILDPRLAVDGLTDLCLPIDDLLSRDFGAKTVYITENKTNGISFPPVEDALIIFGLGYGIEALSEMHWLKEKTVWYWGDIDTHGFAILSQIKRYFPDAGSFLMDMETFISHRHLWVEEDNERRFIRELPNLTEEERDLFSALKENRFGNRLRLEQERIAYSCLLRELEKHCHLI
jgi:hypothetical protein